MQDALDERVALGRLRAALAGDEQVEIAHGLASAAQRAGRSHGLNPGHLPDVFHYFRRRAIGFIEIKAA